MVAKKKSVKLSTLLSLVKEVTLTLILCKFVDYVDNRHGERILF
jgi:hypothetical protein